MTNSLHRYELKFLINIKDQKKLINRLSHCLQLDQKSRHGSYPISSLYFDSPDKRYYKEKIDGVGVRLKIRLRWYGFLNEANQNKVVFFLEVKHRLNECIAKDRLPMKTEQAMLLLENPYLLNSVGKLINPSSHKDRAVVDLIELNAGRYQLKTSNIVSYTRVAMVGRLDQKLRLTFDHDIQALPPENYLRSGFKQGINLLPPGLAVMEVKFNKRIPAWLRTEITRQGFEVVRFSKYAKALETLNDFNKRSRESAIQLFRYFKTEEL